MAVAVTFLWAISLAVISIASGDADLSVCGSPPDIHGAVTPQLKALEHPIGTAVVYNCPSGHLTLNVCNHISLCKNNKHTGKAEWTVPEITCNEATCEEPQNPKHGKVKLLGELKVGTLATYSCDPGRKLYGSTTNKCLESGEWTFDDPQCLRSCQVPFIEYGEMGRYETKFRTYRFRKEFKKVLEGENVDSREMLIFRCKNGILPVENSRLLNNNRLEVTCSDGTWSNDLQCKQTLTADGEDKSISSTEPGVTSISSTAQPSVNVEASTRQTTDAKHNEDCFCTYEFQDPFLEAYLGDRRLKLGDAIRLNERVSFECMFIGTALTWQNGLRLYGKVHMVCNTCKQWQWPDVPICKGYKESDAIINVSEDLNVLPGGIVIVQKGEKHRFSCRSVYSNPEWDYIRRKGVSVTSNSTGFANYVSYLDIDKEADELSGVYECYVRDGNGRPSGSTVLHLQAHETGISCPPIDRSGIFTVYYSNHRRINSTVTFHCKDNRMRIEGKSALTCVLNGTWSGDYPKCVGYDSCPEFPNSSEVKITYSNGLSVGSMAAFECLHPTKYLSGSHSAICQQNGSWNNPFPLCEDSTCSIHDLYMSIPESVEPDMSNVTGESVTFGSEVKLKCTENFVMIEDSKAQCGDQGKWKLGKFQCVQGCLLHLDPSSHLIVQNKKDGYGYRTGDSILLSCPPGERLSNKVERIMCMLGRWSEPLPDCV